MAHVHSHSTSGHLCDRPLPRFTSQQSFHPCSARPIPPCTICAPQTALQPPFSPPSSQPSATSRCQAVSGSQGTWPIRISIQQSLQHPDASDNRLWSRSHAKTSLITLHPRAIPGRASLSQPWMVHSLSSSHSTDAETSHTVQQPTNHSTLLPTSDSSTAQPHASSDAHVDSHVYQGDDPSAAYISDADSGLDNSNDDDNEGVSPSDEGTYEPFLEDGSDPNIELEASLPVIMSNNIKVKSAEYLTSCVSVKDCPAPEYPEFAVIGRSNVGKSSLINMLTNNKRLARVSKEPGKTRCINHFKINDSWYLVDLPGYGYAKTGYSMRDSFDKFTREYFLGRPNLAMVYLLVDSSIAPPKIDLDYALWLHNNNVPFGIVFTKADKRKKGQPRCRDNVASFKQQLMSASNKPLAALPPCIVTSSETGLGRTPLLHLIAALRDALNATGRLEQAVVTWQREAVHGDMDKDDVQGAGQAVVTGKGPGKNGKGAAGGGPTSKGPAANKKQGNKKPSVAAGRSQSKADRGRSNMLPGDDIPLPQWKVRATERDASKEKGTQASQPGNVSEDKVGV